VKQVTIEEARNILGDNASGMSDEQIGELILCLELLAKEYFKKLRDKSSVEE